MAETIRLLLIIPHLGGGGAEKVASLLARDLSRKKYELHLALVTQRDSRGDSHLSDVRIHPLGVGRVRHGALPLLRLVREVRPRVILSGMAHLNFLVLLLRPLFPRGTRVLVRQNATVSAALALRGQPRYTRLLYRLLYLRADRVICQSRAMAEDMVRELDMDTSRIAVLANPVDRDGVAAAKGESLWAGEGPHLLAVGRLSREKGFDLLLEALAELRSRYKNADLILAGEGPEEAALKAQSKRLGLEAAVRFVGHVENPYAFYEGASVFVLPSRHEGMPNALLEAAMGGLPIVALPASGGVADLLGLTAGAWLAEGISSRALAAALGEALEALQPGERFERAYGAAPEAGETDDKFEGGCGEFDFDRAIECYERLIDAICAEGEA